MSTNDDEPDYLTRLKKAEDNVRMMELRLQFFIVLFVGVWGMAAGCRLARVFAEALQ